MRKSSISRPTRPHDDLGAEDRATECDTSMITDERQEDVTDGGSSQSHHRTVTVSKCHFCGSNLSIHITLNIYLVNYPSTLQGTCAESTALAGSSQPITSTPISQDLMMDRTRLPLALSSSQHVLASSTWRVMPCITLRYSAVVINACRTRPR